MCTCSRNFISQTTHIYIIKHLDNHQTPSNKTAAKRVVYVPVGGVLKKDLQMKGRQRLLELQITPASSHKLQDCTLKLPLALAYHFGSANSFFVSEGLKRQHRLDGRPPLTLDALYSHAPSTTITPSRQPALTCIPELEWRDRALIAPRFPTHAVRPVPVRTAYSNVENQVEGLIERGVCVGAASPGIVERRMVDE